MPEVSCLMEPVKLQPYSHQVGGSNSVLSLNETTLCKPLNPREHYFYLNMPEDLKQFTPEYRGLIEVKLQEDSDGYITYIGYLSKSPDHQKSPVSSQSSSPVPSQWSPSQTSSQGSSPSCSHRSSPESSSSDPDSPVLFGDKNKAEETERNNTSIRLLRSGSVEVSTQTGTIYHTLDHGKSGKTSAVNPWTVKCQKRLISKMKNIDKDSQRCKFILLENVAAKFQNPCVLDIKMGTRQHGDDVSEEKKQRFMKRCQTSTSSIIGTRLCGMQVYQANTGKYICHNKYYGRSLTLEGFKQTLYQFLHNGCELRSDVIDAIIQRLQKLSRVVTEQDTFRFYSSSLLLMYEGHQSQYDNKLGQSSSSNGPSKEDNCNCDINQKRDNQCHGYNRSENCLIDVRMIDFAHSTHVGIKDEKTVHNGPDTGYLFGLQHLTELFSQIKTEGCV